MSDEVTPSQPVEVNREELYRQVWETPMVRLAAEYGITGNGLAKICNRLKVPYPPRGWWAKKSAGKKVITYRLPDRDGDAPAGVRITPTPESQPAPPLPDEATEALENSRRSHQVTVS